MATTMANVMVIAKAMAKMAMAAAQPASAGGRVPQPMNPFMCYAGDAARVEEAVRVAAAWGRVVRFDSRRITHEVRPTSFGRWALTAWINDGPDGAP